MNQKRFIQEITQKSTSNAGISFINKKAPVRRLFEPEAFHFSKTIFRVLTKPLVWIW
jgi:hypothetical protein